MDDATTPKPSLWSLRLLRRAAGLKKLPGYGLALLGLWALLTGLMIAIDPRPAREQWVGSAVVSGVAVLLTGCLMVRQLLRWVFPLSQLLEAIESFRRGDGPIGALEEIRGPLRPLSAEVSALCHQIRLGQRQLRELEHEMRQRVANRTELLERRLGSMKQIARRDGLTGLQNRLAMDVELPHLLVAARDSGEELWVLMIDVDHFKPLNDTLGHAAGDEFLRSIGQIIRSSIRQSDLAFRYGGDEFAVVLRGCDRESAESLANRLDSLVLSLVKPWKLPNPPGLSIGLACQSPAGDTPATLLARADADLYDRKAARKRRRSDATRAA